VAVSAIHHLWSHAEEHAGQLTLGPEELAKRDAYREDPEKAIGAGLFTQERLRTLAEGWSRQVGCAIRHGPELFEENYAEVRYEDLLERPEEEIGRLFEFLGAHASEEVVRRCVDAASFERWSKGRAQGEEDSTALLRKGVAGGWGEIFTDRDRRVYKEVAGQMLIKLGYEKDYDW
jgi:hypothetical protein